MPVLVTPLKNAPRPGLIDEITAGPCNIHIERMAVDNYWLNINGEIFEIKGVTTAKHKRVYIDLVRK